MYPSALTRNLTMLSYFSLIGIATTLFLVFVLLDTGLSTPHGSTNSTHGTFSTLDLSEFEPFGTFNGIIYSLGLQMVGFAGHATFPSLYVSLKEKEKFTKLINIDYFFCFLLYFTMAFVGYLLYTSTTKEEITINLYDNFSKTNFLVDICIWTIIINPSTKFGLMLNAVASVFEQNFNEFGRFVLRTFLCFLSLLITLFLPSFALICAFIGAFCSFIISAICPIACYLKLCKVSKAEKIICHVLLLINIFLSILGTSAVFINAS